MSKLIAKFQTQKLCLYQSVFFQINCRVVHKWWIYNHVKIMIIVHTLLVYESLECHILSQKNSMTFPDHVDNIFTYIDREDI